MNKFTSLQTMTLDQAYTSRLADDQIAKLVNLSIMEHDKMFGRSRDHGVRQELFRSRFEHVKLLNRSCGAQAVIDSLFTLYSKGRHTPAEYLAKV